MRLPIVERELRVASRQRRTYWERIAWGILSLSVVGFVLADQPGRPGAHSQLGGDIFVIISGFAFFYALISGIILTADSISEEKRDGTLGLLFLTHLKGYDVILGKMAARSLHAIFGMLTVIPIMAITFLMGGVAGTELAWMALMLLNTLFYSLAFGMLISTFSRAEMRARVTLLITFAVINLGLPSLASLFDGDLPDGFTHLLFQLTPVFSWTAGFGPGGFGNRAGFWSNALIIHVMAWVFLVIASISVKNVWKDKTDLAPLTPWRLKWKRWRGGTAAQQNRYRTHLLQINPLVWLTNRDPLTKWLPIIFLALCLGLVGTGLYIWGDDFLSEGGIIMYGLLVHTILKIWATIDTAKLFSESKKSGALDLLITTPMGISEIVDGYWSGLIRQFRWGVAAVLFTDLALISYSGHIQNEWLLTCFAGMLLLVVDLLTIGKVAMWFSLSRKAITAVVSTLLYILLLPWVCFLLMMISSSRIRMEFEEILIIFLGISLMIDLGFYLWSSFSLDQKFRSTVTNQYHRTASKRS